MQFLTVLFFLVSIVCLATGSFYVFEREFEMAGLLSVQSWIYLKVANTFGAT